MEEGILTFSSVKTRMEPFGPIHLKLEVDKDQIRVIYQGTEEETLLKEVSEVLLDQNRLTISKIFEALQERKIEVSINKLRAVLKHSNNGIVSEQEKTGKSHRMVYFVTEVQDAALGSLSLYPPIGGVEAISDNLSLNGEVEIIDQGCKALTLDSQGLAVASQGEKRGVEKRKSEGDFALQARVKTEEGAVKRKGENYECLPDGQITY